MACSCGLENGLLDFMQSVGFLDHLRVENFLNFDPDPIIIDNYDRTFVFPVDIGRPRRRWEETIEMGLQEVECGVMDWNDLAEKRDRW